jgi:phenylacetate-coenzyme A ligase PaaK-like adenylate-forming protein
MNVIPFFRRNLFWPLWVAKEKSPRLMHLNDLNKSQYYSRKSLEELQFKKFKNIISHAYHNTTYYRMRFDEAGVTPRLLQTKTDIEQVPFLTKADILECSADMIATGFNMDRLSAFKTGGSTGEPATVYKDPFTVELGAASGLRVFRWAGWEIGEAWGRVWGNPPSNDTLKQKLRHHLIEPMYYLDTMNLNDKSMFEFARILKRVKPSMLHGHSHSLYIFALFCKRKKINHIKPKAIVSTSMMLMPNERAEIEEIFQSKVTNLYGCEEVGLIGCECEKHQGLHLNMENVYVEFINDKGQPASDGTKGAIVVTSLINRSMPIIRYKLGDIGIPCAKKCECGRELALMQEVCGRVADFLVRKDGSLVAGVSLVERTLTVYPGIRQMQIVQEDLDNIVLNLVKNDSYNREIEQDLKAEFKNLVGSHNTIHINFMGAIKQEDSGKYRFSISKVQNPYMSI